MASNEADDRRVLAISGSTRHGSTNTALCRTAARCAPQGVVVECWPDIAALPHFNPDDDHDPLPEPVVGLRSAIAASDAVLFCTPEYAGTLPGTLKNLLDWTVGGIELSAKPVAWVNVAGDPLRGQGAHDTLATVLGYVQARIVPSACRSVPVARELVDADGLVADASVRSQLVAVLQELTAAAGASMRT
jgi:chromate reductase, NAD(P)H dehydrogenase (quinone)